ncbi:hypothetical protein EDD16DRAFT_1526186 [Pisolithus croceorrhizus]|nr:hypothetical protein EDD16DRAFT_1526186 [Pisolithus croceorrhizus]
MPAAMVIGEKETNKLGSMCIETDVPMDIEKTILYRSIIDLPARGRIPSTQLLDRYDLFPTKPNAELHEYNVELDLPESHRKVDPFGPGDIGMVPLALGGRKSCSKRLSMGVGIGPPPIPTIQGTVLLDDVDLRHSLDWTQMTAYLASIHMCYECSPSRVAFYDVTRHISPACFLPAPQPGAWSTATMVVGIWKAFDIGHAVQDGKELVKKWMPKNYRKEAEESAASYIVTNVAAGLTEDSTRKASRLMVSIVQCSPKAWLSFKVLTGGVNEVIPFL